MTRTRKLVFRHTSWLLQKTNKLPVILFFKINLQKKMHCPVDKYMTDGVSSFIFTNSPPVLFEIHIIFIPFIQ